ncbi:M23 family metallopeptidase [Lactobacillus corticis]|uniref:Peptidase M23 n=1 Tax=Lactobacillus corticis TaxID=2201249 RepID=A0A916QHT9_9LACO|nr:M23 family metallopeptidase [Lactobacillus corticis]GFZ27671.1 peptidase M23 [Lactobacillus corticis]
MKKESPTKLEWLALIGVLLAICGGLFYSGKQAWDSELATINQSQKPKKSQKKRVKKPYQATWGWPFKKIGKNGPKYEEGQQYGKTKYLRRLYPTKSYWHDGWDFGFSQVGQNSKVLAVHAGRVHKVGYAAGIGYYIWVISDDGYVEVYQEGFADLSSITVKKGQKVKLGQTIGYLTGNHLHLGITKTSKDYVRKKDGAPDNRAYSDNGIWLNPVKVIKNDLKKAEKN